MSRLRTVSQYTNVRHESKRHCRDDLACAGCCSCVEQLKNQNKILREKVELLTRESQDREKLITKMSKTISDLEKRKEEFDKIEDFKAKVREAIRKQLEEEKKADEFILRQRVENGKKEKKAFQEAIQKLEMEGTQRMREISNNKKQIKALQDKLVVLQTQMAKRQKENEDSIAKMNQFKQRNKGLQRILQEKSHAITRIQAALSQTQEKFMTQKIKAKNNEFESQRHQEQLKVKKMEISSLQKSTQEKSSSINNLTAQKEKLGKLVAELDSTVHSYSQLSNQLRERICISEDYALQKEIQYKQLEMDYYDTVYQRLP